jgi:membrane-anchored glycerophosphoryl diester phosphodiesterase (GDPDase)
MSTKNGSTAELKYFWTMVVTSLLLGILFVALNVSLIFAFPLAAANGLFWAYYRNRSLKK